MEQQLAASPGKKADCRVHRAREVNPGQVIGDAALLFEKGTYGKISHSQHRV
jgi:hypothetical protein